MPRNSRWPCRRRVRNQPRSCDTFLRADIFSLGATFYHLVSGRPPFTGKNPMAVISKHLTEKPEPPYQAKPGLPGSVSSIIAKMMAKAPEDRYQDYAALLSALANALAAKPVAAEGFQDEEPSGEDTWEFLQMLEELHFADVEEAGAKPSQSTGSTTSPVKTTPTGK